MTDKNQIPLGKKGSRTMDEFVETGGVATTAAIVAVENEREVKKTFRIPGIPRAPPQGACRTNRPEGKGHPD